MALKFLRKKTTKLKSFLREYSVSLYLSPCPFIINMYGIAFETDEYYIFAQEYALAGDLFDIIPPQVRFKINTWVHESTLCLLWIADCCVIWRLTFSCQLSGVKTQKYTRLFLWGVVKIKAQRGLNRALWPGNIFFLFEHTTSRISCICPQTFAICKHTKLLIRLTVLTEGSSQYEAQDGNISPGSLTEKEKKNPEFYSFNLVSYM